MQRTIYLDNAASAPIDPRVREAMWDILTSDAGIGNPASTHYVGHLAAERIEQAATELASLLNCAPADLYWTSGSTQSIELALHSLYDTAQGKNHIITMSTEHKATHHACDDISMRGATITRLLPLPNGYLELDALDAAITDHTLVVSILHVNNETGTLHDIAAIGERVRARGVLFHVDATQSVGKFPLDMAALPVDLLSGSAHKFYGPKGIGFLYVRGPLKARIHPLGGTLPTHQIVGMGVAASLAQASMAADLAHVTNLNRVFREGLGERFLRVGTPANTSPYILNGRFEGILAQSWLESLPELAFSAGSACNSSRLCPSHVLKSLGLKEREVLESLRFSFGRFTTQEDIEQAQAAFASAYERLSKSEGLWRRE